MSGRRYSSSSAAAAENVIFRQFLFGADDDGLVMVVVTARKLRRSNAYSNRNGTEQKKLRRLNKSEKHVCSNACADFRLFFFFFFFGCDFCLDRTLSRFAVLAVLVLYSSFWLPFANKTAGTLR